MSEAVPPTAVAPPAPPTTQPQPPTQSQPVPPPTNIATTGTILQLPPNIGALTAGEQLEAVVTARLANSQSVIQTRLGPITVQTNFALSLEARILVQVTAGGTQPAIQIIPQQGLPSASPPPATSPASPTTGLLGSGPGPANMPQTLPPLPTTVPNPPAFQGATDSQTQIRGSLVTATVIRVPHAPGSTTASHSASPVAVRQAPNSSPALAPGDRLAVRIAAVTRPGTGAPPASPGSGSMTGTVTGTDISGQAVVRTNSAELSLAVPRALPTGSNLLLQTTGFLVSRFDPGVQQNSLVLAQRWETLNDLIRTGISTNSPNAIHQNVPHPGPQMTSTILFFIAALRAGDLRSWLGQDAARLMEREGLLGRITEEFGLMQRIASEPAGQDWRLFLIPIISDEQLHQLRFFVRDNAAKGRDEEEPRETRFVIEVTFTNLGPFQFDGLARPKALDLIIRILVGTCVFGSDRNKAELIGFFIRCRFVSDVLRRFVRRLLDLRRSGNLRKIAIGKRIQLRNQLAVFTFWLFLVCLELNQERFDLIEALQDKRHRVRRNFNFAVADFSKNILARMSDRLEARQA
jgi:hypothetical protein